MLADLALIGHWCPIETDENGSCRRPPGRLPRPARRRTVAKDLSSARAGGQVHRSRRSGSAIRSSRCCRCCACHVCAKW